MAGIAQSLGWVGAMSCEQKYHLCHFHRSDQHSTPQDGELHPPRMLLGPHEQSPRPPAINKQQEQETDLGDVHGDSVLRAAQQGLF